MSLVKPANCTCKVPEVVMRNINGHDPACPVYIEWKANMYPPYPKPKLSETFKPFTPEPCFAPSPAEVSIKEFVESGALDDANRVLGERSLKLNFHKIGDVFSNAVFITRIGN